MFSLLVDAAFKRAQDNGDLENLPGAGKPIAPSNLNSDPFAHVYGESGTMTPFSDIQSRIREARKRLTEATEPGQRKAIQTEISSLETRKAIEMETWKRYD